MYPYPQRPPHSSGSNVLVIVLVVVVALLILGGGGCLLCVGLAASAGDSEHASPTPAPAAGGRAMVRDGLAIDLESRLRAQGVPATSVLCPAEQGEAFECELTVGADRAAVHVKKTAAGIAFDVPGVAFLDGAKLTASFATTIASKVDPTLRVPCFTGTLMKAVGTTFTCDVTRGTAAAGSVTVRVDDAKGSVKMEYAGAAGANAKAAPAKPASPVAGPRVVDFVCPAGKAPGGAVRAGCVCGSEILGTACGAAGSFTEVTETARGCRFVCSN